MTDGEHHFLCLLDICMSSLDKFLFISFAHFFIGLFVFQMLSCISFLCILEINYLPVITFALIFSHSEVCRFNSLIISFVVQKLLNLIRSRLFILFPLFWEVSHKGSCSDLYQRVFCLCFPLRGLQFLVLHLGL